jgi:oligopeptide/dipeptide ABC transporter ATP-binding protein
MSGQHLLSVRDLRVVFPSDDGPVTAVDEVSFDVGQHETLGIVGESGSGKTVTSLAILGLLPEKAQITGEVIFEGESLLGRSEDSMRDIRGNRIAMIFQDALAALNPVFTVGDQVAEAIKVHQKMSRKERKERVIELLDLVGIPNPRRRVDEYPHEYSGGMRQRAMIAMSIANDPALLIADEPTTALDVTIQAQVLEVMERIQARTSSSILLITHDLGVVAGITDRIMVMYAGRQMEAGGVDDVFHQSNHPYTLGLMASLPRIDRGGGKLYSIAGQPPSLINPPSGCVYHPRCPYADAEAGCGSVRPELKSVGIGHQTACHRTDALSGVTVQTLLDAAE